MAKINLQKFKADLRREMLKEAEKALKSLSATDLLEIGDAAVEEMKKAIAKGISPIASAGRFPAYKWAGKANDIRKKAKGGGKAKKKSAKNLVADIKKTKYPFNQRNKFPDKRERPVNLKLSGDMLANLKAFVVGRTLEVGYKDELSSLKEQGHREGVNGQPKRPSIPEKGEEFSPSIYRRLLRAVQEVFDRKFKT